MTEVYPTAVEQTPVDQPHYAFRKSFEKVKAEVGIERYLADQGVRLKSFGKELRARCIIHGGDNDQAFSVNREKGLWHCFRCNEGGDLISLCQRIEGGEPWEAMMVLSERYGVERWQRPESWHRKQTRQRSVREAIDAERIEHVRRLIFRLICMPWLKQLPEWMREEVTDSSWKEALLMARTIYAQRRGL